jgi:hypothetical protein
MANAPPWAGITESIEVFLPNGEAEYFCEGGWTHGSQNCPPGKSVDGIHRHAGRPRKFEGWVVAPPFPVADRVEQRSAVRAKPDITLRRKDFGL